MNLPGKTDQEILESLAVADPKRIKSKRNCIFMVINRMDELREELLNIIEYPHKIITKPWHKDPPIENEDQAYIQLLSVENALRKAQHKLLLIS